MDILVKSWMLSPDQRCLDLNICAGLSDMSGFLIFRRSKISDIAHTVAIPSSLNIIINQQLISALASVLPNSTVL